MSPSQEKIISKLYEDLLGRSPWFAETQYWLAEFRAGATEERIRREIEQSHEYQFVHQAERFPETWADAVA